MALTARSALTLVPRVACVVAALGWGVSVIGALAPADTVFALLERLADQPIPQQPLLEYWLRMAALAFTGIGALFAAALTTAFANLRLPLGLFNLVCAGGLAAWNLRIGIAADCQIWDGVFLATTGLPIALWPWCERARG